MPIIAGIVAFFRFFRFSAIANFFIGKAVLLQVFMIEILLLSHLIGYFVGLLALLIFIYKKTHQFIDLIDKLMTADNGNEILSVTAAIFQSFGIWQAFADVYNLFSPLLLTVFGVYGAVMGIKFFSFFRKRLIEYYKFLKI
ncbi:hypothetical protein [Campylobacter curvus]|uniref:hypothetical protein n=1 Tax=Campylobacter curvus TaxID=200 RepID=UPI0014707835|nr:hypothetical protein [Campylobacter curvus]